MSLLVARDLAVFPPGRAEPGVSGVTLSLAAGEWITLGGPNGGGKTSLLLGLAGLWPSRGLLELHGRPFGAHSSPELRRGLGVVLQEPGSQILHTTVFDEIAFGPRNLGRAESRVAGDVEHWARRLCLIDDLGHDPAGLSAGRQQMVLLAAALAGEPEVLLADEGTAHLDPAARSLALDAVARETGRGMAVLWVSQLADEAGRATRTLTLGPAAGEPPSRTPAPPRWAGSPLAVVAISPQVGEGDGPRVRLDRGVDIPLPRKGIAAILGPNAAGKSVVLGAVAGLIRSPQISIRWCEEPRLPAIAALQFPEQQIFEERVADELVYAAVARGVPREAALETATGMLAELELDAKVFLGRKVWDLAGGERRLVEVIGALSAPASIYLLDEPTAGLDRRRRHALAGIIERAGDRAPVLLASQDRDWVLSLTSDPVELGWRTLHEGHQDLKNH